MSAHSTEVHTGDGPTTVVITHPNGGISEVTIGVSEDGRLDVSVDPSQLNGCNVDVDEIVVAELDADPQPVRA